MIACIKPSPSQIKGLANASHLLSDTPVSPLESKLIEIQVSQTEKYMLRYI